jgi:hypothetical protein
MREKVEAALMRNESIASISRWIKPPLSQPSICKFANKIGASLAIVRAARQASLNGSITGNTIVDASSDLSLAKGVLAADPIISRLERKYQRLDTGLTATYEREDFSAAAKLETAETQAMRLHAELEGRLNTTQSSQVTIQVAMVGVQPTVSPMPADMLEAEVID